MECPAYPVVKSFHCGLNGKNTNLSLDRNSDDVWAYGVTMSRAQKAAKKAMAEILRDWKDPHGAGSIMDERWLCGLDVNEEAMVVLQIRPSRPHCPCCLVDLADLKTKLEGHKKIVSAQIEVVDVPDAHRWTEAINA